MIFFFKLDAVHKILETTQYGDRAEIGIDRLITENFILAAFPPHDGDPTFKAQNELTPKDHLQLKNEYLLQNQNPRATLNKTWSSYRIWYKNQPIELVKNYFGEKIAFYFAWLGAYTTFL